MTRTHGVRLSSIVITLALAACGPAKPSAVRAVPPEDEVWLSADQLQRANIRVASVEQRPIDDALTIGGKVAFDDLHVVHVFSPVTGRVARVLGTPGIRVAKGAPLVTIVSPDIGAAFSDLVKAEADVTATGLDFKREERLLGEDATSRRSFEAAQDAYRRATAELERARQRVAVLRAASADRVTQEYVLRSAIDGEVIARNVNPGIEVVGQYSGGASIELFTVGDIKSVWVYVDVPDGDIARIHSGDAAEIRVVAYPGRVFKGTVDLVSSTVDPVLRTTRIRCTVPNSDEALKPEMFATVSFIRPGRPRVVVPHDAAIAINEATYVYVESGTRDRDLRVFKRRPVTLGDERDGYLPVIDGLEVGERVVVAGAVSREQPNDEVWPTPKQLDEGHIATAKVEPKDVAQAVTIGGRLTFDDTMITHVFSPVNGRITKVLAQVGQRVTKGAPLVAIASPDLGSYMADVAKAAADVTQAEHEAQRQRELFDAGVGAKRDLEAAEDTLHKAKAEYERAKQLAELVKGADFDAASQEYILRSPIAGEVIARKASPALEVQGQYANGGSSSNVIELFTIGETDRLWVLGDLYEIDLPRVTEGDAVAIHVAAHPGKTFTGKVAWVADVLDPAQHTAKVRCVVDNPGHELKPEMYERVEIAVPGSHVLAVPRRAVMRVDGETVVFVKTGETKPDGGVVFKRRRVIARIDDNAALVPISSGLQSGEVVATEHALMLLGML